MSRPEPGMENQIAYCENKTRGSGSSFFYAFLFLPEEKRRAMMALYAFCREVDDIADEVSDKDVALRKLAFWSEELERVFDNKPRHPVGKELHWTKEHFSIDHEVLREIIDGMVMDITQVPIQKPSDLSLYSYRVAGAVGLLSIEVFGYTHRKARDFATSMGEALQYTNILRDLKEDADRRRIYLPQEDRIRFGVADQDFYDGKFTDNMKMLLLHYGDKTLNLYKTALDQLPGDDRESLRPSLIMGAIYYRYFILLKKQNFNVWDHPVRILPVQKIWIAARKWRQEKKALRRHTPPLFS